MVTSRPVRVCGRLCVWTLLATVGCGAGAQRPVRVLVFPVRGEGAHPDRSRADLDRAALSAIGERDDLEAETAMRLFAQARPAPSSESAPVESRLEQARTALAAFDYARATTLIEAVILDLRARIDEADGRARLAEAHVELARVLLVHEQREAALAELRTARHIDPRPTLDPARYAPELVALYDAAAQGEGAPGSAEVATTPEGAWVTLDGRERTRAPAHFADVPPGRHYVRASLDGFEPIVAEVLVAEGEASRRALRLAPGNQSERAAATLRVLGDRGHEAPQLYRSFALELTGTAALLLVDHDAGTLSAYDASGAPIAAGRIELDDDDAVAEWLDTALPPPDPPFYTRWWFWAPSIGALVAGSALAAYFATRTPDVELVAGEVHRD